MLNSMIDSPTPTRAEVTDIAQAVLDGAASVMLTGETAVGKYPERAIWYMKKTVEEAQRYRDSLYEDVYSRITYRRSDRRSAGCCHDLPCDSRQVGR